MTQLSRYLTHRVSMIALAVLAATGFDAGAQEPPFGVRQEREQGQSVVGSRRMELEREFLGSRDWFFYHNLADLPADMRHVLSRVAGGNVVSPGEPIDLWDVTVHPAEAQHLYTAVTAELGVIVWHTRPLEGFFVIYDRRLKDACRFTLPNKNTPVVPLDSELQAWVEARDPYPRCHYIDSDFFD